MFNGFEHSWVLSVCMVGVDLERWNGIEFADPLDFAVIN